MIVIKVWMIHRVSQRLLTSGPATLLLAFSRISLSFCLLVLHFLFVIESLGHTCVERAQSIASLQHSMEVVEAVIAICGDAVVETHDKVLAALCLSVINARLGKGKLSGCRY